MSKKLVAGILALVLVGCVAGFLIMQVMHKSQLASLAKQYENVVVQREDMSDTVDTTGTLSFSQNGELYPAYNATVTVINNKVGDWVHKGDVLMVLDSSTLRAAWMEAKNTYEKAVFNLHLAQKTLARTKILYQAQATTIDELESAQNTVDTDQSDVELAQYNLSKLQKNSDGVNFLSSDRSKLWIRAPFDGVIAWIDVKNGESVQVASSTSTSSTLLLTMAADNSVEVTADVDESEIDKVKQGQKATVTLNDKQATQLDGTVTAVGKIGDEDSDVVVFPVTIKVELPPIKVNSGMTCDVTIHISSDQNRISIPSKAVVNRRGRTMVRIEKGTGIEYVPVTLGKKVDNKVEVLSGLQEGTTILVDKTASSNSSKQKNNDQPPGGGMMGGGPPMGR